MAELEQTRTQDTQFSLVVIAGGTLMAIGSLLPWATLTTAFGNVSKTGTDGDGTITLIAGVVVAVLGFAMRTNATTALRVLALLASLAVGAVVGIDFADVQRVAGEADSEFARINVGVGLYVVGIGAVLGFGGAIASLNRA